MKAKNKVAVIFLFLAIWAALFSLSIKRIGIINTAKNIAKPVYNYFYTPDVLVLCDFETSEDFWVWQPCSSLIERSSNNVYSGENSAKVTLYNSTRSQAEFSGIILEDQNIGPKGEKDWSRFRALKFEIANPGQSPVPLVVKIKDKAERSAYRPFSIKQGTQEIVIDLEEIGSSIDLENVVYVNIFVFSPKEDYGIYIDALRLDREDLAARRILSDPKVEFAGLDMPQTAKRGTAAALTCSFLAKEDIRRNYRVFIHVSHMSELSKRSSDRQWFINADNDPWVPTSRWAAGQTYEIGPLEIFIPKSFPAGEYAIQAGLYNADQDSYGSYYRYSSNEGAFDFRSSYPRLRYANPDIKDYIVGYLTVTD